MLLHHSADLSRYWSTFDWVFAIVPLTMWLYTISTKVNWSTMIFDLISISLWVNFPFQIMIFPKIIPYISFKIYRMMSFNVIFSDIHHKWLMFYFFVTHSHLGCKYYYGHYWYCICIVYSNSFLGSVCHIIDCLQLVSTE